MQGVLTKYSFFYINSLKPRNEYRCRYSFLLELAYQDSNLDKQNQNLLCCHYTISQTLLL